MQAPTPDLLTTREAAARVDVTMHHIMRWARSGRLTNYGRGRHAAWSAAEVDAAYQRHLTTTQATLGAQYKMRAKGKVPSPPKSLPYRPLASTCRKCGELRTYRYLRKTEPWEALRHDCDRAYKRQYNHRRYAVDPAFRAAADARKSAGQLARNDRSRTVAGHHGEVWTGPQVEIAAREDLTAAQVAVMLGRTIYAVRTLRRRMRMDPRIDRLLGATGEIHASAGGAGAEP